MRAPCRAGVIGALLIAVACTEEPAPLDGNGPPPTTARPARPNVLIILTDDQRVDTMGVLPRTRSWFADVGTTFSNTFATTPLCCPSRATIFSGRYAHNHEVLGNLDAERLDQQFTIQRYLSDAGYRTAISGKFLNDWDLATDPSFFDRWTIFNRGYPSGSYNVDGRLVGIDTYSTTFIAERALEYLDWFETGDDEPWFLFVAPFAPHEPWVPEPAYAGTPVPPWRLDPAVGENVSDKPPIVADSAFDRPGASTLEDVRVMRADQLRTLRSVDDLVDALFRRLGLLGEEDTLAFFMSDNGFLWGEHGLAGVGEDTGKRFPYLPSVRVPLIVRWPGHVAGGATDQRLAANVDVAATIMEAAGVDPDPAHPLDGRSLFAPATRSELLLEYFDDPMFPSVPSWASVLTESFQYVEWYAADRSTVTFREYYDLTTDPSQLENLLADDEPSNDPDVPEMGARLATLRVCSGTTAPRACA
jgi:arylsulfatase A-like enzyme